MNPLAISTHWNAYRHASGEALIEETRELGFERVELGYDLTADLAVGVRQMVEQGVTRVDSVHNFCPVPVGAPRGHPELFELASPLTVQRENAVQLTLHTVRFAAELGAGHVVIHCGNVRVRPTTRDLIELAETGGRHSHKFEKQKTKLMLRRDKKVGKQLEFLKRSLEEMLPECEEHGVRLGIENLPSWESLPNEQELVALLDHFKSPYLGHWHDTGHGRIRQNMGFIDQWHWLGKLQAETAGLHIHDVRPPARDHVMPPEGELNFEQLASFIRDDTIRVLEPATGLPVEEVLAGRDIIKAALARGKEVKA